MSELARVFDAFTQGDHAVECGAHRFGGLGLGLAISRTLVQLHGGMLRATSPGLGKGATFIIELHLERVLPAVSSSENPTETSSKPLPGIRILLVEDHLPTRTTLRVLLVRRDHEVAVAGSVAEARVLANLAQRPDSCVLPQPRADIFDNHIQMISMLVPIIVHYLSSDRRVHI